MIVSYNIKVIVQELLIISAIVQELLYVIQ